MKRVSILFLKVAIILVAILSIAVLIKFPQTEGRAANLDLLSIYTDPFIIYVYISSIPFYVGLIQAFKLLGYFDKSNIFTQAAVKSAAMIKKCAMSVIAFTIVAETYLFIIESHKSDDIAGGVMMGVFIIFASSVITTAAAVLQKLLQNGLDLKSENELTV